MGKCLILILMSAAFLYAAWCVFVTHRLPVAEGKTGLSRRFCLAALVFSLFWAGCGQDPALRNRPTCYAVGTVVTPEEIQQRLTRKREFDALLPAIRAAWLALDPEKADEFQALLATGVEKQGLDGETARLLAIVYGELAEYRADHPNSRAGDGAPDFPEPISDGLEIHDRMTREPDGATKERTSLRNAAHAIRRDSSWSCRQILQQLRLLRAAHSRGAIDGPTMARIVNTMVTEISILAFVHTQEGSQLRKRKLNSDDAVARMQERFHRDMTEYSAEFVARFIVRLEALQETKAGPNAPDASGGGEKSTAELSSADVTTPASNGVPAPESIPAPANPAGQTSH